MTTRQRVIAALLLGFILGAVPATPLVLLSSFTEDRPAFWLWPFFGFAFALCAYPATKAKF